MSEDASSSNDRARFAAVITVLRAIVVGFAVVFAIVVRVEYSGEKAIADSTAALRSGDARAAATYARRAAGFYAPGAPHVRVAYERLIAIARAAEGLGDRDLALFAWRGVRTASIETTWLVAPHADDRRRADEAIARLEAAAPRPVGTRNEPSPEFTRDLLAELSADESPRAPWIVALLAGVTLVVAAGAGFTRRAVLATGRVDWKRARPFLIVALAGAALWLLALWRA